MSLIGHRIVDGVEFGGVEFLVEKGSPIVVESVQALDNAVNQPVLREFRQAGACMASGANSEVFHRLWSEVTLVTHRLHNALIDRPHPVSALASHIYGAGFGSHRLTDTYGIATNSFESGGDSLLSDCKSLGNYL